MGSLRSSAHNHDLAYLDDESLASLSHPTSRIGAVAPVPIVFPAQRLIQQPAVFSTSGAR